MDRETIPEDIRRFILTSISSVPLLEALLLLRSAPDRLWDQQHLAQRLYLNEKTAGEILSSLHESGFLRQAETSPSTYAYHPAGIGMQEMVDRLAETYAKNLIEVTNLIHSNVSRQAQQFADAFKWRKDS